MGVKALKGFKDILPDEVHIWQRIEGTARDIFHRFGFAEIRVPILEKTDLFVRSIGEVTDIVEKEMYTFTDRNGDSVTLRPEGTAPLLRAYIEHGLHVRQPVQRLYTIGPMFRHERPQKGRLRQFHQLSAEVLGSEHPRLDAEVMAMAWLLLQELGLRISLEINSLGCPQCRPSYKEKLVGFLDRCGDSLCADCQRRRSANPLRVLDCKSENCREKIKDAPATTDHLCGQCRNHFQEVRQCLQLLDIPHKVNSFMVRGLDYYTRTTFELLTGELGAQSAVGAGGRYDGLVEKLGGPNVPGIGFGLGIERLALLMSLQDAHGTGSRPDLFLAALGEQAAAKGLAMAHALRTRGLRVILDHEGRSLKSQMKAANKLQARYALIIGEAELEKKEASLRKMETGDQEPFALSDDLESWSDALRKKLNS